jgi:transcriptional regulator with PAS, ATPase and Fis domain
MQKTLAKMEKEYILTVLQNMQGNRTHTAKVLGIGIRTLQRKLKKWEEGAYGRK